MADPVRIYPAVAAVLAAAFPAAALAQDGLTVSGNAAVVSEYRFRGVDLSGGDPALQGGIDLGHASGIFAGAWGSTLDDDTTGLGHSELDLYAGWSGPVAEGITATAGAIAYLYPGAGPGDFDYFEAYGSLRATLGPADAKVGVAYAPEQDSLGGDDNLYLYAELGAGVPGTPVSLSAHLGYTDGFLTYTADGDFDYFEAYGSLRATLGPADAKVGVAYAPEQDSLGGTDNLYLYAELGAGLPGTPVSLAAHLGYTDGFLTYTADGDALDWSLGATYAVTGNLSLGASYVGAQGRGTPDYAFVDDTVVGSVTLAF